MSSPVGVPVVPSRWRRESHVCRRRCRAATCRSPSARTSLSGTRRASVCGRSPGGWAGPVDDLAGAAPQRVDADLAARLQGVDRAVACRASRPPAEDREAGRQRAAARLRAGPAGRASSATPTDGRWSARRAAVEGPQQAPPRRPARGCRAWSPEQIAHRLPVDFPDDESMRISHEAIYQALYVQSRGALKRELVACLRTGRALRVPRARARSKAWAHVTPEVMISERPAEAEDRAVPGHWEGDLIIGLERSAIGTLVERTTRFTMLVHLPREAGYGVDPAHEERPRARRLRRDHDEATRSRRRCTTLPEQLRRSLTWDRGKELSAHAAVQDRDRHPGLLRRPAQPLAARHEREHQRAAAPVLPEGHRPVPLERRRDRSRRRRPQHPTPQDPRLEDPRRSPQRAPTLAPTSRCCDDRLNPPWLPRSAWTTHPGTWSRPRRAIAISSASTARWLVIRESIE